MVVSSEDSTMEEVSADDAQANVPVGITIAYLKRKGGNIKDEKLADHETPQRERSVKSPNQKSLQMLLESAMLYAVCLVLPTLLSYLSHLYRTYRQHDTTDDYSWYQYWSDQVISPTAEYLCDDSQADASYSWSTVVWLARQTNMCRNVTSVHSSVLSEDVAGASDVLNIAICSMLLAIVRIAIVQSSVTLENSDTLEAMVRCKSIHLLSSDYTVTPISSPVQRRKIASQLDSGASQKLIMPNLTPPHQPSDVTPPTSNITPKPCIDTTTDSDNVGFPFDDTERTDDGESPVLLQTLGKGEPAVTPLQLFSEDQQPSTETPGLVDQSIMHLADATAKTSSTSSSSRLYAGPRYATALFRLLYSTATVLIALVYFRDADFWPWYVFGHGKTSNCWDLSGGLTVGMDSDFDHRNSVLKRYFLWQASYHWHSFAFHVLSVLLLLFHPTNHAPRRFLSVQKNMSSYLKRLGQHGLALALIAVAYVFSSLRRLGAIGFFAFDISSWFLHLLQICINAPKESRLRKHGFVARVWYMVLTSFVLTRLVIFPALWYSAIFESKFWLRQLEMTLWRGSAAQLRGLFHVLMFILEAMSVYYFRRLLRHPHIQRILGDTDEGGAEGKDRQAVHAPKAEESMPRNTGSGTKSDQKSPSSKRVFV